MRGTDAAMKSHNPMATFSGTGVATKDDYR